MVHDVAAKHPEHSIVIIENGHVTGRKVGDGASHVAMEQVRNADAQPMDHLSYLTKTPDGKILKSSTMYIRGKGGKGEHLLPDVQAAANMYMAQASEAKAAIKELDNQVYMARYIRNYLTNKSNSSQLLPANSGIDNPGIATQISEYNSKLLERNSLVSHSSEKNPLVVEMDASLSAMRSALLTSIDNLLVTLNAQIKSQRGYSCLLYTSPSPRD